MEWYTKHKSSTIMQAEAKDLRPKREEEPNRDAPEEDNEPFISEDIFENSAIERILRGTFRDPLLSSSDEETGSPVIIDWDKIISTPRPETDLEKARRWVPCLYKSPVYPKLSALSASQHNQLLKVLSERNPEVFPKIELGEATEEDLHAFEALKDIYENEKQEFKKWARRLWQTDHCSRALRLRPHFETVYEAEFLVRAGRMSSFPKHYKIAAQISLEQENGNITMDLNNTIISVSLDEMPFIMFPDDHFSSPLSIEVPCVPPQPCEKHKYQIKLPHERAVSTRSLPEIHQELAKFAISHRVPHIASENALKCLVTRNRPWTISLSVCETISPDGAKVNVLVLDSEFSVMKEGGPEKATKAYRHMLEYTFVPPSVRIHVRMSEEEFGPDDIEPYEDDVDDSDGGDGTERSDEKDGEEEEAASSPPNGSSKDKEEEPDVPKIKSECEETCVCEKTVYEYPPLRSFKTWHLQNEDTGVNYNIIIHCPHKAMHEDREIILEPLLEYQLDLGASEPTADSLRTMALSLKLRPDAYVLYIRLDATNGEVAGKMPLYFDTVQSKYPELIKRDENILYTTINQLQGLMPGHYVLQYKVEYGNNALLMAPCAESDSKLTLTFSRTACTDDLAKLSKNPPDLNDQLLPFHKYRKILPCAFTPYEQNLPKRRKKLVAKKRTPPQAIQWGMKKDQMQKQ